MSTARSSTTAGNPPGQAFMYGVLLTAIAGAAAFVFELHPELVLQVALYPAIALSILVLTRSPTTLTAGVSATGLAAIIFLYSVGLGRPVPLTGMTVLLILVGVAVYTGGKNRGSDV